ncbi:hypothetical protein PGS49_23045, partial [Yersinia intermedia]
SLEKRRYSVIGLDENTQPEPLTVLLSEPGGQSGSGIMFSLCLGRPVLEGALVDTLCFAVLTAGQAAGPPCLNVVFLNSGAVFRHFISLSDEHNGMLPGRKSIGM